MTAARHCAVSDTNPFQSVTKTEFEGKPGGPPTGNMCLTTNTKGLSFDTRNKQKENDCSEEVIGSKLHLQDIYTDNAQPASRGYAHCGSKSLQW